MKTLTKVSITVLIALFLDGCAEFSQHAADTVVIKPFKPDHCTYLGYVLSTLPSGSQMYSNDKSIRERHINELKKKAHDLGANTIVITSARTVFKKQISSTEHSMAADAYRCQN